MSGELAGRTGVVTGGGRGIGLEIARRCIGAGARVALFEQDRDLGEGAARELGADTLALQVDVSDEESVERAVGEVVERAGALDFLVNNAGIRHQTPFDEETVDTWRRTIDVNLTGSFICSRAAVRVMLAAGGGKIVNIASIAGRLALRERAAYNASKAGVMGLTRSIAVELGGRGIYCNAVAPGLIETPLSAHYFRDETMRNIIVTNTPLGRWGQGNEVAEAVVFLCSAASDFVQGETLYVDGGWNAGKGY
jgi:NAD(P)-dependent dehydrogenase (short-subunit alcohol dehydrogenase family)